MPLAVLSYLANVSPIVSFPLVKCLEEKHLQVERTLFHCRIPGYNPLQQGREGRSWLVTSEPQSGTKVSERMLADCLMCSSIRPLSESLRPLPRE